MIWFVSILVTARAADVVFTPNLDVYYGTKISVDCSIETGMKITLEAPTAAKNMRFSLNDPSCLLEKNGNYHTITTRLSGCNNDIYINSTTLTIVNRITNILAIGRQPVKLESRVGCLFHQQEVSIGALLKEDIPAEIVPTPPPTTSTIPTPSATQPTSTRVDSSKSPQSPDTPEGTDAPGAPDAPDGPPKTRSEEPAEDIRTTQRPESTKAPVDGPTQGTKSESDVTTKESGSPSDTPDSFPDYPPGGRPVGPTSQPPANEPDTTDGPDDADKDSDGKTVPTAASPSQTTESAGPSKEPADDKPDAISDDASPSPPSDTKSPEESDPGSSSTTAVTTTTDGGPIDIWQRSGFGFPRENPWTRLPAARGTGLFFAKLMLYKDSTFNEAHVEPPMLKTDDMIYAGVKLTGGPSQTALAITNCWASNVRHKVMDFPIRQAAHEITLNLVTDGCATDYPPDLVTMISNGDSQMATFSSAMFKFVDYDTAHIYCRVRVCPLGPCPQKCNGEGFKIQTGVVLGGSGDEEEEDEEEAAEMPSFEMLIQTDPYQSSGSGPLLGATVYRVQPEEPSDDRVMIEEGEETILSNFLNDSTMVQIILLALLGTACVTLVLLGAFVIRKRRHQKLPE